MSDPTTTATDDDHADEHKHEHNVLEAFGVEGAIEHPGELPEETDTTDDADAPAP
jgi:hypothetical protein